MTEQLNWTGLMWRLRLGWKDRVKSGWYPHSMPNIHNYEFLASRGSLESTSYLHTPAPSHLPKKDTAWRFTLTSSSKQSWIGELNYFCPKARQVLSFAVQEIWEVSAFILCILRGGKWGRQWLSNLPKIKKLVGGVNRILIQAVQFQHLCYYYLS